MIKDPKIIEVEAEEVGLWGNISAGLSLSSANQAAQIEFEKLNPPPCLEEETVEFIGILKSILPRQGATVHNPNFSIFCNDKLS